jgi:mono/diheme cytochrome c family protein/rhodanese-related sulfurtransferase
LTSPEDLPSVRRVKHGKRAIPFGAACLVALAAAGCLDSKHEAPREKALAESAAHAADQRFEAGAAAFTRYCALCHAADATGYAADHAPSLVSTTFLASASDEYISRGIREGRPGTAMAGYGKLRGGPLDDDEVAAIIAFLRDRGPARERLATKPVSGDATRGEAVYAANCQRCHGTRTDRGDAVHLANMSLLSAASDSFLRYAVVHGRPGTPMPAFQGVLGEDEIDNVVAMLRTWATPPPPERIAPPELPPLGEVVINPKGPNPEFTLREDRFVPIEDVKKAIDAKKRIVIIDARATSDWLVMHIPGSISVPYYGFSRLDQLPKDGTWITAYCACPHHASGVVVDELRKRGFTHTAVLDEGILEWKKRAYPTIGDPSVADAGAPPPVAPLLPMPGAITTPRLVQHLGEP